MKTRFATTVAALGTCASLAAVAPGAIASPATPAGNASASHAEPTNLDDYSDERAYEVFFNQTIAWS